MHIIVNVSMTVTKLRRDETMRDDDTLVGLSGDYSPRFKICAL